MTEFSDYIVYVDESGDHGLTNIDPHYPIFCLTFCIVDKHRYIEKIVPQFQKFKMKYFGHDVIILHEHELRKQTGDFGFLRTSSNLREKFLNDLSEIMSKAPFSIIASVIRKDAYSKRAKVPQSPYEISLLFCMERLFDMLISAGQAGKTVHVVFECRGKKEDQELELYFRRIISGEEHWGYRNLNFSKIDFVPIFRPKQANSTGVQMADLSARPIGLSVLRPNQPNRAFDRLKDRVKLKCFP